MPDAKESCHAVSSAAQYTKDTNNFNCQCTVSHVRTQQTSTMLASCPAHKDERHRYKLNIERLDQGPLTFYFFNKEIALSLVTIGTSSHANVDQLQMLKLSFQRTVFEVPLSVIRRAAEVLQKLCVKAHAFVKTVTHGYSEHHVARCFFVHDGTTTNTSDAVSSVGQYDDHDNRVFLPVVKFGRPTVFAVSLRLPREYIGIVSPVAFLTHFCKVIMQRNPSGQQLT